MLASIDPIFTAIPFIGAALLVVSGWLAGSWKAWFGVLFATFAVSGLLVAGTQSIRNDAPVTALHPELADRAWDSADVRGAGFPQCQWATDDPVYPGVTEPRSAVLWFGVGFNLTCFFFPILVGASVLWFVGRKMGGSAGQTGPPTLPAAAAR